MVDKVVPALRSKAREALKTRPARWWVAPRILLGREDLLSVLDFGLGHVGYWADADA